MTNEALGHFLNRRARELGYDNYCVASGLVREAISDELDEYLGLTIKKGMKP